MINRTFSPEWKLWIWSNIVNGYDKESIFNVLLNNGFDYSLIRRELEIEPTNALIWQRQYTQENLNQPYEVELYPYNKSMCDNPRAYRIENNLVEIYHFPDLLTLTECDELISLTDKKLLGHLIHTEKIFLFKKLHLILSMVKNMISLYQTMLVVISYSKIWDIDYGVSKFH